MTREDVLREFAVGNDENCFEGWRTFDMADEIVRLRAKLQAVRELVRALPTHPILPARSGRAFLAVELDNVLAALGGDE